MDIQNENDITKLKTEIERLEEWIKEYKKWSKNDKEFLQRVLKENEELKHKLIVSEVKASGIDLKNNREETIIKILTVSIENEEMRKRVETTPKDKITLNIDKGGYQLIVSTIPSQTIAIRMSTEEIEDILKKLETSNKEYTEQKCENNRMAEIETMLKNSQYSWMKVEPDPKTDKWQVIDTRNGRVRFQEKPQIVYETIKEITQNQ